MIERAAVLLQLVYACSDCIVEKETADGELDIPVLEVASVPSASLLPEPPRPSLAPRRAPAPSAPSAPSVLPAERVFPTPNPAAAAAAAGIELQGGANIPGMSGFAPIAATPSPMGYAPQPRAVPSPMMYAPQPAPAMVMVPRDPRMEMAMMEPPMAVMEPPMAVMQAPCYQAVGYQESPYGSANGYVY